MEDMIPQNTFMICFVKMAIKQALMLIHLGQLTMILI